MGLIIVLILLTAFYVLMAIVYAEQQPKVDEWAAGILMAVCVAVCTLGGLGALLVNINTRYEVRDGIVTYEQCSESVPVSDNRTGEEKEECVQHIKKQMPLEQYLRDEGKTWAMYGAAAGSLILFGIAISVFPNIIERDRE